MKLSADLAKYADPSFSIILPRIVDADCDRKLHVREALESDSPLANITRALLRVELNQQDY